MKGGFTMLERTMLTTVDNPYDPFDQFDEWFAFDVLMGYDTCGLLARFASVSPELSEFEQDQAIELAVSEILESDVLGIYKLARR